MGAGGFGGIFFCASIACRRCTWAAARRNGFAQLCLRCRTGLSGCQRLNAESPNATWVNACGKLTRNRRGGEDHTLRRTKPRPGRLIARKGVALTYARPRASKLSASQNVQGKNTPSPRRQPVEIAMCAISGYETLPHQLALDGRDRAGQARIVRWPKPTSENIKRLASISSESYDCTNVFRRASKPPARTLHDEFHRELLASDRPALPCRSAQRFSPTDRTPPRPLLWNAQSAGEGRELPKCPRQDRVNVLPSISLVFVARPIRFRPAALACDERRAGIAYFPEHIELKLAPGGIAGPHGLRVFIPGQPRQFDFRKSPFAGQAVKNV